MVTPHTRYSVLYSDMIRQSLSLDNWTQVENLKIPAVSVNICNTALHLWSPVQVKGYFSFFLSDVLTSGREVEAAEGSTTLPYTPNLTTYARTATTSTKTPMFITCVGIQYSVQQEIFFLTQNYFRADCFSTDFFRGCLEALMLQEQEFLEMVQIIGK